MWLGGLDGAWGGKDQLLTLALTLYRDGLCGCGKPIIISHDDDSNGWYETRESICHACAVQEKKRDNDDKPTPGEKIFVVFDPEGVKQS